jgi:hypothetical protein
MKFKDFNADSKDLESVAYFIGEDNRIRTFCTIGEDRTFSLDLEVEGDSYIVTDYYVFGEVQEYVSRTYKLNQLLSVEDLEFLYLELKKVADDIDSGVYEDPDSGWKYPASQVN